MSNLSSTHIEICLGEIGFYVAERAVEIWGHGRPSVEETLAQSCQSWGPASAQGGPHSWNPFATVNIKAQVTPEAVHLVPDTKNLWRGGSIW